MQEVYKRIAKLFDKEERACRMIRREKKYLSSRLRVLSAYKVMDELRGYTSSKARALLLGIFFVYNPELILKKGIQVLCKRK